MVKGALCTVGNPFAARAVAMKCREFRPDVVHFHNTFPLISPLAVRAASKYASVVMTLHNDWLAQPHRQAAAVELSAWHPPVLREPH